jgi:hypothetical protein
MRDIKADRVARTDADGIDALEKEGPWDILYLDHDLGFTDAGDEMTGYNVMCWLEANPQFKPGRIEIVSSNPVGRARMQVVIDRLYGKV